MRSKKGMMGMMIGILLGTFVVMMLMAVIPGWVEVIDILQNSNNLNCVGYQVHGDPNNTLSYNATIGTRSTVGCMVAKLYIPYLIMAILIGIVMKILYDKTLGQSYSSYG